jgi:hypothetical protein
MCAIRFELVQQTDMQVLSLRHEGPSAHSTFLGSEKQNRTRRVVYENPTKLGGTVVPNLRH